MHRPPRVMLVHHAIRTDLTIQQKEHDLKAKEIVTLVRYIKGEPADSRSPVDPKEVEWGTHLPHSAEEHEANVQRFSPKLVLLPRASYAQEVIDQLGFTPSATALRYPHCYFEYGNDGPSLVAFRIPERPKMHVSG